MTTVIPAPAFPESPTAPAPAPVFGLPTARFADPDACGTLLRIDVDDRGRSAVLRVRGEIDMLTAADLRAALDEWLTSGAGTVVVDLRGVSFVDCTGIGLLADARQRAARAGIRLRIVAGRVVARTAALLELTAVLGLHDRP